MRSQMWRHHVASFILELGWEGISKVVELVLTDYRNKFQIFCLRTVALEQGVGGTKKYQILKAIMDFNLSLSSGLFVSKIGFSSRNLE